MHAMSSRHDRQSMCPRRVLVATALGDEAAGSLRVASARAAACGAELALCHVGRCDRRQVTEHALGALGDGGLSCDVFVERGDVAPSIAHRASSWSADLVVVGGAKQGQGAASRQWQSDVGLDIVRRSPCSVLVTRHTPGTGRIVVGTDLTETSIDVVRAARAEQERTGAAATLVHCVPCSWIPGEGYPDRRELERVFLPRIALAAAAAGLRSEPRLVFGSPAEGLADVATELAADLIVVGGRSLARRRASPAGIAERVARDASCAVLVVK